MTFQPMMSMLPPQEHINVVEATPAELLGDSEDVLHALAKSFVMVSLGRLKQGWGAGMHRSGWFRIS